MFANIVNLTIALEVSQGVARFYPQAESSERKKLYASTAFWFTLACYVTFTIIMLTLTPVLAPLVMGKQGLESAFRIGIVYVLFNGLFYLIQNQFRWELRSKTFAAVSLVLSITTAVLSVTFAYIFRMGLEGLLIAMLIGSVFATTLGVFYLRRTIKARFDRKILVEMLSFSSPLVLSGIMVWITLYIDRIMINKLLSLREVGLYGVGYRIASIAGLAITGFQGALTPLVFARQQEPETPAQIASIFRIVVVISLLMFLGLALFAKFILEIFTTPDFYDGAKTVVYLVPAILISGMYVFAPGIGIAKKTKLLVWIGVAGAVLNFALNFLLIPKYGIEGAGLATMLGYLAVFVIQMYFSQMYYKVPHRWVKIIPISLATWVCTLIATKVFIGPWIRIILNLILLAIFGLSVFSLGLITSEELRQFKSTVTSRFRTSPR
jgi:O-antigen/teichoic acid export membrane protein